MTDQEYGQAISYLLSRAEVHGVASIGVKDGQVFMFKKAKLQDILEGLGADQEEVVIFVKTGGALDEEVV